MPAFVRETSGGTWEVVEGDRVVSTHDSQIAALDAALARNGGKTKDPILRDPDTKDLNGAWRWLHATDVEDEPAYDGARIDETTVTQAVASLNAQAIPRPINGGTFDSPAHGPSGDTLANGYAHHAVEVVSEDGRHGAYVIAELVPDVDRNVASGRIAFTSIGLGGTVGDDDAIRDAAFDHLALTNSPAVTTLTPSAAIRKAGERFVAVRSSQINRRRKGSPVMKSSVRSDIVTPLALRGPALDALTTLCASIGIGIDDELSADDWASPAKEALCALRMIAKSERIVEGLSGATATAARSARTAIVRSFKRAEVADADLAALCAALGLEPGASVADMIKAAEGMKKPAEPKVEAAAPAGDTEATRGLRSDLAILRSQHAEAAAELVVLRKERLADRSEKWLDGETKARKLALRAEDRAELLAIIDEAGEEKGRSLVLKSLATRSAPPVGQVIKGASAETDPTAESDGVSDAAIEAELPAIEAAFPKEPAHMKYARARKAALRKKNGR